MDFNFINHHNHQLQSDQNPSSYQVWNNFFLKVGIPNNMANQYAITFSQHRIRIDMLKELTKEILIDMGIKAMGDILDILRHARDISLQDELKAGAVTSTKTNPTVINSHNVVNARPTVANNFSRKMPISTRSTSSTSTNMSSNAVNKVQSQVNLNSGALIASSNNSASQQEFLNSSNKRSTSALPNSLAKRLRPAANVGQQHLQNNVVLPEKTLTVYYPPKSAIERAQQRIGLTTNSSPSLSSRISTQPSIKSRLGQNSLDSSGSFGSGLRSASSSTGSQHNNSSIKNSSNNTIKTWAGVARNNNQSRLNKSSVSTQPNNWIKSKPTKKEKLEKHRQPPNRSKAAVFSRLGE